LITRMQAIALSLGASLLFLLAAPVEAQDLKIGFVNVPFLLQNAPQTQVVDQQIRAEFAPRQAEFEAQVTAFNEKVDRLERDGAVMGAQERANLQREIEQSERDLSRMQQILQEDAGLRQEELVSNLQSLIAQQIQGFAEDEGFDLILANVVYASQAIDITEDVLEALREAAGSDD
jgi:outer membrane protein